MAGGRAQPAGGGRAFLILSSAFRRAAGLSEGDPVKVVLRPVAPNRVDGPSALSDALADAPDLAEIREGLTPGVRRGFAHRVASAKRPDTVARRVAEVVEALESDDPTPYRRR